MCSVGLSQKEHDELHKGQCLNCGCDVDADGCSCETNDCSYSPQYCTVCGYQPCDLSC